MKMLKRTLAMFMVLCMMFSIVPMTVFADDTAGTAVTASAEADDFIRVFHLDCGRKYFTVEQVKELIDAISAAYYTHMELAIGNDGLRLLLDDMSVTANGTTYASDTVKSGIQSGNAAYSHSGEWTQAEMDAIISYADSKNIEIIPLVNNPGHMDSILAAMKACGIDGAYNGSARTVDVTNDTAVAFTKAFVAKYMDYFAGKGSTYFNIGADEYANDIYKSGSMGWGHLQSINLYDEFIAYVNDMVDMCVARNLKPIAFNDGIYFEENDTYGTFKTDLIIAAWTGGWTNFDVASTSYLANKGHKILNTNERWYYVPSATSGYTYSNALSKSQTVDVLTVTDEKNVTPMGSMNCVWFDYPNVDYDDYKSNVMTLISTLSSSNPDYFKAPAVEPDPEPDVPVTPEEPENVTLTDNSVSVTAPGLESIVVKVNDAVITEEKVSKTYSITLNDGNYTDAATVKIPYDSAFDGCNKFVGRVGEDEFEVTKDGDFFICEVPHFSDVEIEGYAVEEDTVISSGGTAASYILDTDGLDVSSQYLIVYDGKALTNTKGSINVTIENNSAIPESDVTAALWTAGATYQNVNLLSNNGNYLYPQRSFSYSSFSYTYSLIFTTSKQYTLTITNNKDGTYNIERNDAYVAFTNDGWGAQSSEQSLYFYKYTPSTATFTVDASLQESRIAALTVENDNYTDASWTTYESALKAAENKFTTVEGASYTSETAANTALNELKAAVDALETAKNALEKAVTITIKYVVTGNDTPIKTETRPVSEKDTSVTVESFNANNKFYVVEDTTLAITPATVKEYTVTVTETEENLSGVDPLTVEYWITNLKVIINSATSIEISATSVYSENGTNFDDLVPANDGAIDNPKVLWKGWLLPTGYHQKAAADGGLDMTINENGNLIQKIRYWNKSWQYFNGIEWKNILETDQVVAYYLQRTQVTQEVITDVVDWGEPYGEWLSGTGETWFWDGYVENGTKYVFVDFAVVYQGGAQNPETFPTADTWFFHFDGHSATKPRVLGSITFNETAEYEIWKVTVTDGTSSGYSSASNFKSTYDDTTETVVWSEEMGGDPHLDNLTFTANRSGKLVRIYVRAVENDDSLTVVYYDEKFGDTLYTYPIIVKNNVTFESMKTEPFGTATNRVDVSNSSIENALGIPETFETDLTKVPEAVGKYDSELYSYTGSIISEDKTTLYLYYNINTQILKPNLVVDFGLPVTFKLSDIVTNTGTVDNVGNLSARYGTVSYNSTTKTFTYVPTKILPNLDVLSITLTILGTTSTTNVGITPATTVYYEESFLQYEGSWAGHTTAPTKTQTTAVLGEKNGNYGYDVAYTQEKDAIGSNGTYAYTTTAGATASFTFTGTGFELYGNSNGSTGIVSVLSQANADNSEKVNKIYMIDTKLSGTPDSSTTGNQHTDAASKTYYSLPFISEKALPYGTYTVTIKRSASNETKNPIQIDGVRIINTIKDSSIYVEDLEDEPSFYQLRDVVLTAIGVSGATAEQVFSKITNDSDDTDNSANDSGDTDKSANDSVSISKEDVALVFSTEEKLNEQNVQDLLDKGPKNELYLYGNQSLTFKVTTDRVMQLGLKAPSGSTGYTINVKNGSETTGTTTTGTMATSVDMFYKIANATAGAVYTVTVTNTGSNVLSVTDLKICDDPNAAFVPLTQADIENVLSSIAGVPEEPVITYADAELNVRFVDYTGRVISSGSLTANGVTGTDMTFSASDILGAASMPARYAFVDADSVTDAIVACGESETVTVQIGRVATLRVVYMNLFGRKLDTVVITRVQTEAGYAVIPASEIRSQAPAGARVIWPIPTYVSYGSSVIVTVPVI